MGVGATAPTMEGVHPISQPAIPPEHPVVCGYRNRGDASMQPHQQLPKTPAGRGSAPKLLSVKTSLTFLVME